MDRYTCRMARENPLRERTPRPIDPRNIEVIDDRTAEILRRMSPTEKIQASSDMFEHAKTMIAASLRAFHPQWSEDEIRRETMKRFTRAAE
jgi:hypothetical protein